MSVVGEAALSHVGKADIHPHQRGIEEEILPLVHHSTTAIRVRNTDLPDTIGHQRHQRLGIQEDDLLKNMESGTADTRKVKTGIEEVHLVVQVQNMRQETGEALIDDLIPSVLREAPVSQVINGGILHEESTTGKVLLPTQDPTEAHLVKA